MTWNQFWPHVQEHYEDWPTPAILAFEIAVAVAALLAYRFLNGRVLRIRQHFALIAIGVFALEFFTGPMWENRHLGFWAYVYSDVSWILTIAWGAVILLTVFI